MRPDKNKKEPKIKHIGREMVQHYIPGHFQKKDKSEEVTDEGTSDATSLSAEEVSDLMNMLDLQNPDRPATPKKRFQAILNKSFTEQRFINKRQSPM